MGHAERSGRRDSGLGQNQTYTEFALWSGVARPGRQPLYYMGMYIYTWNIKGSGPNNGESPGEEHKGDYVN